MSKLGEQDSPDIVNDESVTTVFDEGRASGKNSYEDPQDETSILSSSPDLEKKREKAEIIKSALSSENPLEQAFDLGARSRSPAAGGAGAGAGSLSAGIPLAPGQMAPEQDSLAVLNQISSGIDEQILKRDENPDKFFNRVPAVSVESQYPVRPGSAMGAPGTQAPSPQDDFYGRMLNSLQREAKHSDVVNQHVAQEFGKQQVLLENQRQEREFIQAKKAVLDREEDSRISKLDSQLDKMHDLNPNRMWENMGTGRKILATFSIFLGGLGGGENRALGIINDAINKDIMAQKAAYDRAKDKKGEVMNTYAYLRKRLDSDEAALNGAYTYGQKASLLSMEEMKARYASPIQQERAQRMIMMQGESLQDSRDKTRSSMEAQRLKAEKPTAEQFKAGGFAQRVEDAEEAFTSLEKEGFDRTGVRAAINSKMPSALQIEPQQRQEQAERNFINAVLRRESGAVISPEEFESASLQYFPRAGDAASVVEQKRRNRQVVIATLQAEGRNALPRIESNIPSKETGVIGNSVKTFRERK